ncbi:hypothetical protein G3545_04530 [Starkeya sp. ORNL1]|uniref:hypothetical protein n=1 Tax=Starkeya sp. ORNL1 TaxID=2709380 RepID=UPI0014635C92|nr:hypothetical protein [Starkeya sp. ORNL1]QJP12985.1 hypothetical protein G3545_04530 [Starkeya sp. ORNL1]
MLQDLNFLREPATQVPMECQPRTPQEVLNHPSMSVEAKRATLASWASDRHAVPNFPGVRQLENGSLVSLAEILQALRELDDEPGPETSSNLVSLVEFRGRHRARSMPWRVSTPRPDDDPPPRPAAASFPVSYLKVDAVGSLAAGEQSRCRAL